MLSFALSHGTDVLPERAVNREDALLKFGATLGTVLTCEDQGTVADHMMDEWNDAQSPRWVRPHIPVWVKREQTSP